MEGKQEEDGGVVAERSKAGVMPPPPTEILWHPGESIAKRGERGIDEWNLQAGM